MKPPIEKAATGPSGGAVTRRDPGRFTAATFLLPGSFWWEGDQVRPRRSHEKCHEAHVADEIDLNSLPGGIPASIVSRCT